MRSLHKTTEKCGICFFILTCCFFFTCQTALASYTDLPAPSLNTPSSSVYDFSASSPAAEKAPDAYFRNPKNPYDFLKVVTQINRIGDTYFIVDCYHNQVLYSSTLDVPLTEWRVMTNEASWPHTIAGDGVLYLVDDTENNRVLIFQKMNGKFQHTQTFPSVGNRPHYIVYDEPSASFYVWSSTTGEMYIMKRDPSSNTLFLNQIRKVHELDGIYVRSFTIAGDRILFPSGNNCSILSVDKNTFEVLERFPVPASMSGMAQILPIGGYYYITVSTGTDGSQTDATLLRTKDPALLSAGGYETIYDLFETQGTPYYISRIGNTFYLTNHRSSKGIWQFQISDDTLRNIHTVY